jgi:hypothetical protein
MANLAPIGPLHQPNYYVRFDSGHLPGLPHFNITGSTAFLTATLGMKLEAVRFPFLPCRTLSQNIAFGAPGLLPLTACHAHRLNLSASSLLGLPLYRGGARRQNRTVPAYDLPPIMPRRCALLTAAFDPPQSSNGNEIATPAVSLPKGQNMIEENKPADAPRLRRAQDRTGHHLLGRNWRRLIMARRWSMPTNHRSETDAATGEESEYTTPFLKGYTVCNVEQIDGLPEHNYAKTAPRIDTIERAESIALFELKDDRRPAAERTAAAGRVPGANFVCRGYEAGSLQPPLQVGGPQEGDGCDRRRYVRLAADFVGCDRCDEKRRSSKD